MSTRKRVNITLAEDTLRLLERVVPKGDRSRLIDRAVRTYIADRGRSTLRKHLEEGAVARAERDIGIAEEWFAVESEVWPGRRQGK